ncbi:MAG: protein arginine kinase [Ammonifex sp.]|jgi:protein arginine kinase|nr:MAG: protein arginine kinase [Ammonifex sp.]
MALKEILTDPRSRWMEDGGPEADVVVSSRVRLARDLAVYPFPHRLRAEQAEEVLHAVRLALDRPEVTKRLGKMEFMRLTELTPVERHVLVEKHLVSPDFLKGNPAGKAVVIRQDETVSIMVNEEDHLRIQCLMPGLALQECWELAGAVDDALEATLEYAFNEEFGYLSACPTNVGTGLRASVMMHLPGLVATRVIDEVISGLSKLGLTVRGLYGEGTRAAGSLFQVSNQITLGRQEAEIINNLTALARRLVSQEREARQRLHREQRGALEDRIFRSYGVLQYARVLNSEEAMRSLSDLRLGLALKIIKKLPLSIVSELMVLSQPAFLIRLAGKELNPSERDVLRAQLIRERLQGKRTGAGSEGRGNKKGNTD